jgi:hypothetical protein
MSTKVINVGQFYDEGEGLSQPGCLFGDIVYQRRGKPPASQNLPVLYHAFARFSTSKVGSVTSEGHAQTAT